MYLAGATAARTGDEMSGPALLLAGFAVTGSAAEASALLSGVTISAAIGGPVLGALLDRAVRPGRLLTAALALYVTGLAAILAGLGRVPQPLVLLAAVATGLLGPALSGGWTAQLPRVAPPDTLPRANALDTMTYGVAGLTGPALAGTTAQLFGAPTGVVVSMVLIGLALPVAWGLPGRTGTPEEGAGRSVEGACRSTGRAGLPTARPGRRAGGAGRRKGRAELRAGGAEPREGRARSAARPKEPEVAGVVRAAGIRGSVAADLLAGARCIVRTRPLARATLTSVLSCMGEGMLIACVPLLGERVLGAAAHGPVLLSCMAVSALSANAVLARFPHWFAPDTLMWAGALLQAAGLALAATGRPSLVLAAVLVVGAGAGPQLTALFAVRHREAPERLRGLIFTTGASLKITGFAVGAALAGPLAVLSLSGALATAAGVELLAVLAFFARAPKVFSGTRARARTGARTRTEVLLKEDVE